jgi:hypothetical protein
MGKGKGKMEAGLLLAGALLLFVILNFRQIRQMVQDDLRSAREFSSHNSQGMEEITNSNPQRLEEVTKLAKRNGDLMDPATARPLLTLEEFFDGNQDAGSIGYNFYPIQPTPQEFYEVFKTIRERPEVADVRVEVWDQVEEDFWPSCDTIWIITSADPKEVVQWIPKVMEPDDTLIGFPTEPKIEPYDIPGGMQAIGIWWD